MARLARTCPIKSTHVSFKGAPRSPGIRTIGLICTLGLHSILAWKVWLATPPSPQGVTTGKRTNALQVRFLAKPVMSQTRIDQRPTGGHRPSQALPKPSPPMKANERDVAAAPSPRVDEMRATAHPSLPTAAPGYIERKPQGDFTLAQGSPGIDYHPTRFESTWTPVRGSSSLDDALSSARDALTFAHTFEVATGVRIKCQTFLIAGGCGNADPPPRPSTKSGDTRLNMAPSRSLADTTMASALRDEDCISIYRAEQPLPHGCPADTPVRAIDEELRKKSAHARDFDLP